MHAVWVKTLAVTASLWCPLGHVTHTEPGGRGVALATPVAAMAPVSANGQGMAAVVSQRRLVTTRIVITDRGFRPNRVMVVINQPVHIVVVNKGSRTHQFSIPRYYIFTENLRPGQSSDIRFSPWEPGRFDMTSDPAGQNRPEFRGDFIVTDAK